MNPNWESRTALTELDPKGMLHLTEEFPNQCATAIRIGKEAILPEIGAISSIILTGLGGSAAGGDFVKAVLDAEGTTPFQVNRDYHLPRWCGKNTLVFACSYSGNTEETLSAFNEADAMGATIIAVTSGGELKSRAEKKGHTVITVPGGQPPRTAMGFMMLPVLVACERLGFVTPQPYDELVEKLRAAVANWTVENPFEKNLAKQIADHLGTHVGVIYGLGLQMGVVANRWKCQIHENAKAYASANTIPEMNHNEILAWVNSGVQAGKSFSGVLLESHLPSASMAARRDHSIKIIGDACPFKVVTAPSGRPIVSMLVQAFLGDFVTLYVARALATDPEIIPSIDLLKAELAKVPVSG